MNITQQAARTSRIKLFRPLVGYGMGLILLCLLGFAAAAPAESVRDVVIRTSMAEYEEETGVLYARGESTITWQDITMICPYLEVDTQKQEAHSSGEIRMYWGDKTVNAQKLTFQGKQNRAVLEQVAGESEEMAFSAGLVTFDFAAERVWFSTNPVLTVNDFSLRSDTIQYHFPSQLWEALSVHLVRQGWDGRADRAVYREGDDRISLSGNARIEQEGSQLQGETITIYTETSRVLVEGNVEITIVD